MRVGIYNRWLATLGGGERHSLAIAEYLSHNHSVQVITHRPVARAEAAARLNVDLTRVEFVYIPDRPAIQITPLTAEFDFFICASFLDIFPTHAPHSAMMVFFPTPLSAEPSFRLRRLVGLIVKRLLMVPTFEEGILQTELLNGAQVRQTTAQVIVRLPAAPREYVVSFDLIARHPSVRRAIIALDNQTIELINLEPNGTHTHCRVIIPPRYHTARRLIIRADTDADEPPVKMILARFEIEHPRYRAYQILFERWLKTWGLKLYRIPPSSPSLIESVKTYDALWANSKFTQTWIKRYWNLPAQILYPPVDVEDFYSTTKQNRILSVGRFFVGSHNKKHHEMIITFKRMMDRDLRGWELHLAGGIAPRAEDQQYLQMLGSEARGYPIVIHLDLPRHELLELYASSTIYWHAGGYGEDEMSAPIKFEHFGITTVEAMAAGCVPVVISKGGQKEIVQHGQNGFLWNTLGELEMYTFQLIRQPWLREKLRVSAMHDSQRYNKSHFDLRLQSLLQQIGVT